MLHCPFFCETRNTRVRVGVNGQGHLDMIGQPIQTHRPSLPAATTAGNCLTLARQNPLQPQLRSQRVLFAKLSCWG